MFYTFQSIIKETWCAWGGLFHDVPYGDPYIAGITLCIAVVMTCKLVADGKI